MCNKTCGREWTCVLVLNNLQSYSDDRREQGAAEKPVQEIQCCGCSARCQWQTARWHHHTPGVWGRDPEKPQTVAVILCFDASFNFLFLFHSWLLLFWLCCCAWQEFVSSQWTGTIAECKSPSAFCNILTDVLVTLEHFLWRDITLS